jgi:hypothetical protein
LASDLNTFSVTHLARVLTIRAGLGVGVAVIASLSAIDDVIAALWSLADTRGADAAGAVASAGSASKTQRASSSR